jgi:DNA polymerase I-like protein with 3'-5' exonuclease and polymerase domains
VIVSLDFTGQELVLMAEVSGDEALRSCYMGDNLRDGHSLIAVAAAPSLWNERITYEEFMAMRKSKDEAVAARAAALRGSAKTVNFATQFGAMAPKVALTLMSTEEVAQEFIDAKDKAFPGINIWKAEQAEVNDARGYALTLLGARRHLADGMRDDASRAERQGINMEIQGSAAEQTKLAMAEMWRRGLFTGKYDAQFVAPIHDETVASVHRKDVVAFVRDAHACMVQKYANMVVPMESSLAIGRDFSCPVEIGAKWTDEQLQAAVDKLFD